MSYIFITGLGMQKFFSEISKWRTDLEQQSVDASNTSDTVALITYVQSLKKQIKSGQESVCYYYCYKKNVLIFIFYRQIVLLQEKS